MVANYLQFLGWSKYLENKTPPMLLNKKNIWSPCKKGRPPKSLSIKLFCYGGTVANHFLVVSTLKKNIIHCKNNSHPLVAFKRLPTKNLPAYYCQNPIPQKTQPLQWGLFTTHPKPIHNPSTTHPPLWPDRLPQQLRQTSWWKLRQQAFLEGEERRWQPAMEWGNVMMVFFFRWSEWCWGVVGLGWVIFVGGLGLHVFVPKKTKKMCLESCFRRFWVFEALRWANSYCIFVGGFKNFKKSEEFSSKSHHPIYFLYGTIIHLQIRMSNEDFQRTREVMSLTPFLLLIQGAPSPPLKLLGRSSQDVVDNHGDHNIC